MTASTPKHCRLPIADCRLRRATLAWVLALLATGPLFAAEAIYLQGGEEYRGTLQSIADGKLVCRIGAELKTFDLAQIQRIEFQRPRRFDDVSKADQLPDLPVFQALRHPTEALAKRFPQAGHVVLHASTRVTLAAGGRYTVERLEAWRILHERAADTAKRSLTYFPDRQHAEVLYGLTVAPDGSVERVADAAMKDEALYARLPDYNFQHRLRYNLKGPVPGATLIAATRLTGTATLLEPLVLDEVFWDTEPALYREVRLEAPDELRRQVTVAAANGLTATADGVWGVSDAPQVFREPLMPPIAAFAPRLVLAWPKATWADIAKALHRKVGGAARLRLRRVPPRGIFNLVRTQIRGEDVPLDALPDGPARPAKVLNRGFGTEPERALLLAALLRGWGSTAHTVLVRERDDGPLLPDVPRLRGLNRAVVRTTDQAGRVSWLQADDPDRGFAELDPKVQGAQGLNLDTGQLVTVPVLEPKAEALRREVHVELTPDGSAKVTDRYFLRGQAAKDFRGLKTLTEAELQKWAARFVGRERAGVHLLSFERSAFANANTEERMTFVYRVPALADLAGRFLLLRLPNAEEPATDVGRSQREHDLFWHGPEREEAEFVVQAPPGYQVYALGKGAEASADGWSASATFAADPAHPDLVRFRDTWERAALAAPKAAYRAFRAARIARSRLRTEVIVFAKE